MSNIAECNRTNIGIKLSSIVVSGGNNKRGECWNYNVNSQFPVIPTNMKNGELSISVESPHRGYSIQTTLINGMLNGKSSILNEENIEIASLVYVDGIASGPCILYDEKGVIFFEGYLKNGYREGRGIEYNEKGEVVFDGFFKEGKRMNIVELKEMKGYWKEMNEENEVISICKKNEENENDGICYFYSNGRIDKVSEWKNGEEVIVLKRFEGKKMIEFENGVKRYEGEYRDSIKHNYPREGEGEEYDENGKSLVYKGYYWNGIRQGNGIVYENGTKVYDGMWIWGYRLNRVTWICIIIMIILVLISFLSLFYAGITILVLDVIFWTVLWFYFPSIQSILYHSINRNGKTSQIKKDLESTKQLNILSLCFLLVILINVIFAIIPLSFIIASYMKNQSALEHCLGYSIGSSLIIDSNSCNDDNIASFNPSNSVILESIEIGDDCYMNVDIFHIDGLKSLKSLKIGKNSFTLLKSGDKWEEDKANNNRLFGILKCNELESVEIGSYSFSDYGGLFELKNLPELSTIKIGEIGDDSYNFFYSSFVVEGIIDMILLMNRSSTFEFYLIGKLCI